MQWDMDGRVYYGHRVVLLVYSKAPFMLINLNERLAQAVGALGHRDFRLFFAGLMAASLGARVQMTANLWLVYELTDSPLHLGLMGLARGIPTLAFSLMGGIIADRVDRRRFIMVVQAAIGALSLVLAGLTVTGLIRVWHIYLVTILGSSLTAVYSPARTAIIPNLVPKNLMLNAFALSSTAWKMSHLAAPALAGGCIALFGLPTT